MGAQTQKRKQKRKLLSKPGLPSQLAESPWFYSPMLRMAHARSSTTQKTCGSYSREMNRPRKYPVSGIFRSVSRTSSSIAFDKAGHTSVSTYLPWWFSSKMSGKTSSHKMDTYDRCQGNLQMSRSQIQAPDRCRAGGAQTWWHNLWRMLDIIKYLTCSHWKRFRRQTAGETCTRYASRALFPSEI